MNYVDYDYIHLNNFTSKMSKASGKLFDKVTIQKYSNSDIDIYFRSVGINFYIPYWSKRIMLEQFSEETQEIINKTLDYMDSLNIHRIDGFAFYTPCFIKKEG